ncbi:MAG TPA: hypothetical protein VG713_02720 [Pirellulales bacterium]|nr:hypothetical protein [Pirellulales bacterium]
MTFAVGRFSSASVAVLDSPAEAPRRIHRAARLWRRMASVADFLFGALTLIIVLAVLASVPIVQFLSLGYLLEVSGRVVRTAALRSGFVGVRRAARLGRVILGAAAVFLPLLLLSRMAASARLIEPGGPSDRMLTAGLGVATVVGVVHWTSACLRGARIRNFLWPAPLATARLAWRLLTFQGVFSEARDRTWDAMRALRLRYFFSLGLRGAIGALAWLFVPVTLLIVGMRIPSTPIGALGALLFTLALVYLPFVQTRFAAENRLGAMFRISPVRDAFGRAPIAFVLSLGMTFIMAVPLYLLKIQMLPREAAWLPCLFFVVFTWPAKMALGWSYSYGARRPQSRHFVLRWLARLAMLPLAAAYVGLTYLTMYTSWYGMASIYAQHPFLVPVPFFAFD